LNFVLGHRYIELFLRSEFDDGGGDDWSSGGDQSFFSGQGMNFSPNNTQGERFLNSLNMMLNFHSRKTSTDRKFSENIIVLRVENFQLQIFFPTENLCRPITFYKNFLSAKNFPE
jgi:hypothetical protein